MRLPSDEPRWRRYLRFFKRSVNADIDDELRFHFDERIAELIAQGATPEAARARAAEEFGDVSTVRRDLRSIDERLDRRRDRGEWIHGLFADFAYSARSLLRTPIVAATVVVTLALGLGVNVAMFSLLDVLFLRYPDGIVDPKGVHVVWRQITFVSGTQYWSGFSVPGYNAVTSAFGSDAKTALYSYPQARIMRGFEEGATARMSYVNNEYFSLLGVSAARGRMFAADENRFGVPVRVAIVSDRFWHERLARADSALGQHLRFGAEEFIVVGITPPGFTGTELDAVDVWVPLATFGRYGNIRRWWEEDLANGFQILVRPNATVSPAALAARVASVARQPSGARSEAALSSIIRARGPGNKDQDLLVTTRLGGVALLVLLIAVANVVNLLLVRAIQRRREIAVRLAMGISRARLIRLLVSESVLLSAVAAGAAALAAIWGGALLRRLLFPTTAWAATPMHWRILSFAVALALIAGIVAGLVPALRSTNPNLTSALKAGSRDGGGSSRSRLRAGLVVLQAALSVILIVGSVLFVRSLSNVQALDIGFDVDRLTFAVVRFDMPDTARDRRVSQDLELLAQKLRGRGGVENVAVSGSRPMQNLSWVTFYAEADTTKKHMAPTFTAVSAEYFETTGLRFVRGATFSTDGSPAQSVVINEEMARQWWPNENPIGRCMRFGSPTATCFRISGVVETASRDHVIEQKPEAQYYMPLGSPPVQRWVPDVLIVRSNPQSRAAVGAEIRSTLREAFPGGRVVITQMSDALDGEYRPWRMGATLFTLFGVLALIVAIVGIYSAVAYTVGQRLFEFGVRVALGARTADVLGTVVSGALRVVGLGVILGVAGALAGGRLVTSLLYGVEPSDPGVLLLSALLLLVVAVVAALVPAWRAARVNPVTALRAD
jgi:predicted permease